MSFMQTCLELMNTTEYGRIMKDVSILHMCFVYRASMKEVCLQKILWKPNPVVRPVLDVVA